MTLIHLFSSWSHLLWWSVERTTIKSKGYKDFKLFVLLPDNLLSKKVPSHKRSSFLVPVCVLRSHSSGRAVALEWDSEVRNKDAVSSAISALTHMQEQKRLNVPIWTNVSRLNLHYFPQWRHISFLHHLPLKNWCYMVTSDHSGILRSGILRRGQSTP